MCVPPPSKDPLPAPEVIPRTALEFGFERAQGAAALAGAKRAQCFPRVAAGEHSAGPRSPANTANLASL